MGGGGIFLINQETSFEKKNAKKRRLLENIFIPVFFCTSVNCTSSFKRNLKTGFEIKIRGKFSFQNTLSKNEKVVCLFSVFCKLFFKHSILFFCSFLKKN